MTKDEIAEVAAAGGPEAIVAKQEASKKAASKQIDDLRAGKGNPQELINALMGLTVAQMKDLAKEKKVSVGGSKADLAEQLKEAALTAATAPPPEPTTDEIQAKSSAQHAAEEDARLVAAAQRLKQIEDMERQAEERMAALAQKLQQIEAAEKQTAAKPAGLGRPPSVKEFTDMLEELRSEKYSHRDSVPIWEMRELVAARFGPEAAKHAVFDPLLKQWRRENRIRLIAIGDRSRATPEQLAQSIPGENETFCFVENKYD